LKRPANYAARLIFFTGKVHHGFTLVAQCNTGFVVMRGDHGQMYTRRGMRRIFAQGLHNADSCNFWRIRWRSIKRIRSRFCAWFCCGDDLGDFVMLADSVNVLRFNGYVTMTKSEFVKAMPDLIKRADSISIGSGGYSWVCFDNEFIDGAIYTGDSQNAVVNMAMKDLGDWLSHI
jgi:hypothetical protein